MLVKFGFILISLIFLNGCSSNGSSELKSDSSQSGEEQIHSSRTIKLSNNPDFEGVLTSRAKILNATLEADGSLALFGTSGFELKEDVKPYLDYLQELFESIQPGTKVDDDAPFSSGHLFGFHKALRTKANLSINAADFDFSSSGYMESKVVRDATSAADSLEFRVSINQLDLVVRTRNVLLGFPGYDKPKATCQVLLIPNVAVSIKNIPIIDTLSFEAVNPTYGLVYQELVSKDPSCEAALQLAEKIIAP